LSIRLLNEVGSLVVDEDPCRGPVELPSAGNSDSLAEFGVWFAVEFPSVIPVANASRASPKPPSAVKTPRMRIAISLGTSFEGSSAFLLTG
jgi:hypothetical protein